MMIHGWTPFVKIVGQLHNFINIFRVGCGSRMDPNPGISCLQYFKGAIRFHRFLERFRMTSESIMIFRHAFERELYDHELEGRFFQYFFDLFFNSLSEITIGRNINLFHFIMGDKKTAYFPYLFPHERFSAGYVQDFNGPQFFCETKHFVPC